MHQDPYMDPGYLNGSQDVPGHARGGGRGRGGPPPPRWENVYIIVACTVFVIRQYSFLTWVINTVKPNQTCNANLFVLFFRGRGMPPRGGGPHGGAPRGGPGRGAAARGASAPRGGHPPAGPTRGGASTRSRPPASAQRMTPAPALSHQQQHHQHPPKPEGYDEYVSPHH